jgi:ABC-type transporter Mla maintaining outer membrane lipid asymmetry ATPase subunit MlaF
LEHLIGFVSQDDCVLADLTVRENILHSARIRLGGRLNDDKIRLHVDKMITCLGLFHVKDRLTGSVEKRGISGGEHKRVCIAREIIAMPMALILDEPTSGLDATAALSIMTVLKTLSTFGITIICAVHQPRADIFRLLDDILLLHFGESIYMGDVAPLDMHFKALHASFPDGYNPADIMMDVVTNQQLFSAFPWPSPRHRDSQVVNWSISSKGSMVGDPRRVSELKNSFGEHRAPWYRQLLLYTLCGARQQRRQVFSIILEMVTGASAGLLLGLSIYEHKGHLFQGYFRQPFEPLSSAVNYVIVPTVGLLCSLSISASTHYQPAKTMFQKSLKKLLTFLIIY